MDVSHYDGLIVAAEVASQNQIVALHVKMTKPEDSLTICRTLQSSLIYTHRYTDTTIYIHTQVTQSINIFNYQIYRCSVALFALSSTKHDAQSSRQCDTNGRSRAGKLFREINCRGRLTTP